MEMTGEQIIPAAQAEVWRGLNDPEILKACISGCESIEKLSGNEYAIVTTAAIGPVKARFRGKLLLADGKRAIVGSINLAPGSFDDRRELAIELDDEEVVKRLQKIADHDWEHSHPLDLSDEGLLADLEKRGTSGASLVLDTDKKGHDKKGFDKKGHSGGSKHADRYAGDTATLYVGLGASSGNSTIS